MTQRISVAPDPPVAGEDLVISYAAAGGEASVTLDLAWTPPANPTEVTITFPPGSTTITVPTEAESVRITDRSGQSEAFASQVDQSSGG